MYKINENYLKLPGSYLFSNIGKKVAAYKEANPDKDVISLGIGDVTQPLCPAVIDAMHKAVDEMANAETFHGYAPDLGYEFLRSAIRDNDYKARGVDIALDEIFVSDGAKSDSGNIGDIFSVDNKIAVCDPVYPVYVDTNAMAGRTGDYIAEQERWSNVIYMPCTKATNFAPELPKETPDIIYLCFPNNPTGSTITNHSFRNGLIMLIKLVQLLFTMQLMKHTFQKTMCLTQFMNVMEQKHVQLNLEVFLKMPDLQEQDLASLLFQKN